MEAERRVGRGRGAEVACPASPAGDRRGKRAVPLRVRLRMGGQDRLGEARSRLAILGSSAASFRKTFAQALRLNVRQADSISSGNRLNV